MREAELLWRPSEERVKRSQIFAFMRGAAEKYGFAADYASLHRWSVTRRDQFWGEMLEFAGIRSSKAATAIECGKGMLGTKWFAGLEFNFVEHLLRFDDDRIAIEAEDELGRTRSITYRQLRGEVAGLAAGLHAAGVRRGDRVGAFLPNIPETVIAMLATASIGAIFSSCSPDFGINGVFDRFGQIEPKVLFAADGYSYNGKRIECLERVRGIVEKISSIERVIVVPFLDTEPSLQGIRGAASWGEFVGVGAYPPQSPLIKGGGRPVARAPGS
ncbi:MAG: AMP-binding protein, partial [Phycisphaerales bacterium]|nr:AMP-binding protein [Phycisphaerales bacterium]